MKVPYFCIPWIRKQRTGHKDCISHFKQSIEKEYTEMEKFLSKECKSILDVGCGLGGIDILLSKKYDNPNIYLLDNSLVSEKLIYGFDRDKCFYNSFDITIAFMTVNDVKNYKLIDIKDGFPDIKDIDLVVSLLSWGYHYKVEEYINQVYDVMAEGGILILDIREKTNGIDIIKTKFKNIKEISHYNKSHRICVRKELS